MKRIFFLLLAAIAPLPAWASTSGVDTPNGIYSLPLSIQGRTILNIYADNPASPGSGISFNNGLNLQTTGANYSYLWQGANGVEFFDRNVYSIAGATPQMLVNADNHSGGGLAISDDGGFFDYNDGFITYNGPSPLKVAGNNGPGSYNGSLTVQGTIAVNGGSSPAQILNINTNQIWKSAGAGGDPNLYLQYSAPGAVYVGGGGSVNDLHVASGSVYINGNTFANGYFHNSDARLKTNIETSKGLAIITQLRGVSFDWKTDHSPSAGILAQDVEKAMPSAVRVNDKGYRTVEYDQLIAPMIEAIKELKEQNDRQAAEIAELRSRLNP